MASTDLGDHISIRLLGSHQCPHHPEKEVVYRCIDCEELACVDCVSTVHWKHGLKNLGDCIPEIKGKIHKFVRTAEQNDVTHCKTKIKEVNDQLLKNREYYENIIEEINSENEDFKIELDKLTDSFVKVCQDMKQENEDILLNHRQELQTSLGELNSLIQECIDTLQSGNNVQLYDTATQIPEEFKQFPTSPELSNVQFHPNITKLTNLQKVLGELFVKKPGHKLKLLELDNPTTEWREVSSFIPYHYSRENVKSMHVTPDDQVWVSGLDKPMLLTNKIGGIKRSIELTECVTMFCLSPSTQHIWYINSECCNCVKTVTDGKLSIMFETDKEPLSICATIDGNIVIGHKRQLTKYTVRGEVIASTTRVRFSSPPVIYPQSVGECPVTHNLAVVDLDRRGCGGKNTPFVSILSDKLQVLYTYRGDNPDHKFLMNLFDPWGVCFTAGGKLIVIDKQNHSVLLLSEDGRYLQTLITLSGSVPLSVSVCSDNTVLVSLSDGNVKALFYK